MFASAHAGPRGIAIFSTQTVDTRSHCVAHPRVELHFRGFLLLELDLGEPGNFGREIKKMLVGGELGSAASVGHSPLKVCRSAPNPPPKRFCFEEVAQWMLRLFLLHAARIVDRGLRVAGINFFNNGVRRWRRRKFWRTRLGREKFRGA